VRVTCTCGNKFTIGATLEEIRVELCSKCHPFYTGEQRFVDSASRIQKFQNKQSIANQYLTKKVKKQEDQKQKDSAPKTLREMLMAVK
jgi:large subunit ribosomal protein L31